MPQRSDIPIEDFHEDIIGKVIRGRKLQLPALASAAGITVDQLESLLDGEDDEEAIRAVAPQLDLDPNALVISANKIWRPRDVDLTDGQVQRIVAFLESLTGEYEGLPLDQVQNTTVNRQASGH